MREKMKIILGGGLEGLRETEIRKEWTRSRGDMAYVYVIFFSAGAAAPIMCQKT